MIAELSTRIEALDHEIKKRARRDDTAKRLMTIPGIGPVIATAVEALAPPAETFDPPELAGHLGDPGDRGRDFAAWMGLRPRQHSTGGRPRLGRTSKMGQRDLRRLFIIGASAVVRWASMHGAPAGSWLARMLAKKPRMLMAVALANKRARIAWALMAKGGVDRAPAPAVSSVGVREAVEDVSRSNQGYGQTVIETGSGKPGEPVGASSARNRRSAHLPKGPRRV